MPRTDIFLYQDDDGTVPVLEWLQKLQQTNLAAFNKCLFLLNLLEEHGRDLRRPRADMLRDGVHELRTQVRNVNYRILYGFVGKDVALVAHGLTKLKGVPDQDIDLAAERLARYRTDPDKHRATRE
jgi:phage-related protein